MPGVPPQGIPACPRSRARPPSPSQPSPHLLCALLLALCGVTVTAAPNASAASVVAGVGSPGSTVVVVQRVIGAAADGIRWPKPATAVAAWQGAHQLPATGVFSSATWSHI